MPSDADSMAAKAKTRVLNILTYGQHQADRVVNPTTRKRALESVSDFASKRPLISLFIAAQLLTSLFPLLFFATFVLSTITVALLSGIAFALFWTGVALLFLVPTLFFTCGLACLVWLWAVGAYVLARAVYARLPASVRGPDKHVIFHSDSAAKHAHGFDLDGAINAEVAEVRE